MMRLRKLEQKDAPLMLEWMHTYSIVKDLQTDFASKTIDDCEKFISDSQDLKQNIHLAIVDENDEYLGTASLKHLNKGKAEFGITIRQCAMGKGLSKEAMRKIIELAFTEYELEEVYWCVSKNNARAIRFYDKNLYERANIYKSDFLSTVIESGSYTKEQIDSYIWYTEHRN